MDIQVAVPRAAIDAHRDEIGAAITRVLDSGWYILGAEVEAFETEFADLVGAAHGVGVASGTDAVELALRACGIDQGDGVVTVSHTAGATVAAIDRAGALPVLVDIDPATYTIDPEHLDRTIRAIRTGQLGDGSLRVRAVVVVHLYGHPAELGAVQQIAAEHDLMVIEDCAQAHGARWRGERVGRVGEAGAFSFYPTKNLGAVGDGGMVVTSDPDVAERVRQLRQYGWRQRYVSERPGMNSRLDELQAAILRVLLPGLDAANDHRRRIAEVYRERLSDAPVILPGEPADPTSTHVYHQFVVRVAERDELRARLASEGIGTAVLYSAAVHQQPAYEARAPRLDDLPATTEAVREILSLPMGEHVSVEDAHRVADAVNDALPSGGPR